MEQEDSKKDPENPPEVSCEPKSSEKDDSKKDVENPPEVSCEPKSSEKDDSKKDVENPPEVSNKPGSSDKKDTENPPVVSCEPKSSEKDDSKMDVENPPDESNKPESSDKKTPRSLKAKSKIVKKSQAGKSKTKKDVENHLEGSNKPGSSDKKDTENPSEVSCEPKSSEKDDSKKDVENPPEGSNKPGSSDKKSTENPPEVSCEPKSSEKDNSKMDVENPADGSNKPESSDKKTPRSLKAKSKIVKKSQAGKFKTKMDAENLLEGSNKPGSSDKKDTENSPEVSCEPKSSEKDDSKKDVENPLDGPNKPESSDKNTLQSLKVKTKIVKKSQAGKFKTNKNIGSQQIRGKWQKRKNKNLMGNKESCSNREDNGEKQISKDSQQKRTTDEKPKEKGQQAGKNKKDCQNSSTGDQWRAQKNKGKIIDLDKKSQHKQKDKDKHLESKKGEKSGGNRDNHGCLDNCEFNKKRKEKLGGLIFMCNAKTKPDCFRYRVMGVSSSKKDVVLVVKPGLKLFLYDFDLKLMYGIYKASSSGGMKLEPRAFGGSFPVQVRFNIVHDCYPLPESIFKNAIKENYNEKHKFKTELTDRQVRKLTELFRPVEFHSTLKPVCSPPKAIIRNNKDLDGVSRSWPHSYKERHAGDHYANSRVSSYDVLSHEREHRIEQREEIPRNLFLTEKDYQAYGLQGDRRNTTPHSHVSSVLEPYKRDYERERVHRLDPIYRDNVPLHAETLRADPPYLNDSQAYSHIGRTDYTADLYHAHRYNALSSDPYLPTLSREEISSSSYLGGGRALIEADNLQRRESVQDRLYSTYAADALSDYNEMQHSHGARPEATHLPVSSRYSFAGPSYSLR